MKPVMVWHKPAPKPAAVENGAHIGRYALGAVVDVPAVSWNDDPLENWLYEYDVFFCHLFGGSKYCTRIREERPDAIIVAVPDSTADEVFRNPEHAKNWLQQFDAADYIGAVSDSTAQLYGALFNKPVIRLPMPIGTDKFFTDARKIDKADFIVTYDHDQHQMSVQNVAAVARIQRETGLRVIYVNASPLTRAYAETAGLNAEWVDKMNFDDWIEFVAAAKLGVDLYASHGTGRTEITLAYAGTPCVGSNFSDPVEGFIQVDPFKPEDAAAQAIQLLSDEKAYKAAQTAGVKAVRDRFSYKAVRTAWETMIADIKQPDLSTVSLERLAQMNSAAALNEYWSRIKLDEYFDEKRRAHYDNIAAFADKLIGWSERERLDIADVGCGGGHLLAAMQQRNPERVGKMVGMDYAPSILQFAKTVAPDATFIEGDITDPALAVDAELFDIVFCVQALEHIRDVEAALRNLLRISRAHVVISVPNGAHDRASYHVNHWTEDRLVKLLEPYGLREIRRASSHMPVLIARLSKEHATVEL